MKHRVWKLAGGKPRRRSRAPESRNLPNMFINKCPKFQLKTRSGLWEISIGKHLKFKSWTCPKWTVISRIEMPKTRIFVPQIKNLPTWKVFKMVSLAGINSLKLSRVSTGHSTQLNMQIRTIYKKYEKEKRPHAYMDWSRSPRVPPRCQILCMEMIRRSTCLAKSTGDDTG